jgi:cyclophilin family peptidyl-prolyl cis-trans isomerase
MEIRVVGEKEPIYDNNLEELGRFNEQPVLPFNAYGTLAWARGEFDNNRCARRVLAGARRRARAVGRVLSCIGVCGAHHHCAPNVALTSCLCVCLPACLLARRHTLRTPRHATHTRAPLRAHSASSQVFFLLKESELTPSGANLLDGRYAVFGYAVQGQDNLGLLKVRVLGGGMARWQRAALAAAQLRTWCAPACSGSARCLVLAASARHTRARTPLLHPSLVALCHTHTQVGDKILYIKVVDGAENLVNA